MARRPNSARPSGAYPLWRVVSRRPHRRLLCTGMVRNEIDIIETWIAHITSIFDQCIIYDHLSTDGTREKLAELAARHPNLDVRPFEEPELAQGRLMTSVKNELVARGESGWLFFLDADEFLDVRSRKDLSRTLRRWSFRQCVHMFWDNAVLLEKGKVQPHSRIGRWHDTAIWIRKSAINLAIADRDLTVAQGNHRFLGKHKYARSVNCGIRVLHLPIRSTAQLRAKLATGLAANDRLADGEGYATHWRQMADLESDHDALLTTLVHHYGSEALNDVVRQPAPSHDLETRLCDAVAFGGPSGEVPAHPQARPMRLGKLLFAKGARLGKRRHRMPTGSHDPEEGSSAASH